MELQLGQGRFYRREFTDQEVAKLRAEYLAIVNSDFYKLFIIDLHEEIAEFDQELVENNNLKNKVVHIMRGELCAMRKMLLRFEAIDEYLQSVEKEEITK